MRRNLIVAAAAGVLAIAIAGTGAYVYFFSNLRSSPTTLGLSASPSPAAFVPEGETATLSGRRARMGATENVVAAGEALV